MMAMDAMGAVVRSGWTTQEGRWFLSIVWGYFADVGFGLSHIKILWAYEKN